MNSAQPNPLLSMLTPAERLVAVHLAAGLSNKEIGTLLGKAEVTVKHQVSCILRATQVPSRGRFIAAYYQQWISSSASWPAAALPDRTSAGARIPVARETVPFS